MRIVRNAMLALAAVGFAVVAAPSCEGDSRSTADCDYVVQRCRTFCDYGYGCDYYWGCCYDRCWYECIGDGRHHDDGANPPSSTPPPPATDASAPPPTSGDFAVLCAPCTSNDECKGGGLCIQRGGEAGDAGASGSGFCGTSCNSSADCPADFTCTEIGQSKQCVPANGACK